MLPILFEVGGISIYGYGFMIAIGVIAGVSYMIIQGKREVGLTFDQANSLFLLIFIAAFVGGKFFLLLEDPSRYLNHPRGLLTGSGFVFYGSFIFAVPTMLWFFKKHRLNTYKMLDVMAVTTCLVHVFGRLGCFLAGCCYGLPTNSYLGVVFTDPACQANPINASLHPTQLYEASYIFLVMIFLLILKNKRQFYGQLFLLYLILYAVGRSVLEIFRGDESRGFIINNYVSHSQLIAIVITLSAGYTYFIWYRKNKIEL